MVKLAQFIEVATAESIPADVLRHASATFFNFLGCALGGCRHESVTLADKALAAVCGSAGATVLGRGVARDVQLAVLLNAMSSSVYSYDDTHAQALVHPGGPVGSALLALTELRPANGREFLTAYALGVEVACRLSQAISVPPAEGEPGWIQTGVTAGIGAAVGCAKLLHLDAERIVWAMGIAASAASGMRGLSRSMCFSYMAGNAAASGLRAALLAEQGFTSTPDGLEGRFGYLAVFSRRPNREALTDGLGSRYELMKNTFKPYPCGVILHPVIDACLDLRRQSDVQSGDIESIEFRLNPASIAVAGPRDPKDAFEAQVSVHHWAALAINDGAAGLEQVDAARTTDPVIVRLRSMVTLTEDASISRDGTTLVIKTKMHPSAAEYRVPHCTGSLENPMSSQDVERKFRNQALRALGDARCDRLVAMCAELQTLGNVADIARVAAGETQEVA